MSYSLIDSVANDIPNHSLLSSKYSLDIKICSFKIRIRIKSEQYIFQYLSLSFQKAFDLLSLQYDLVVGRTNSNEQLNSNAQNTGIDYTMDRLIISQRRFWNTLVNNLLDLTNRLLPICGENFQQNSKLHNDNNTRFSQYHM